MFDVEKIRGEFPILVRESGTEEKIRLTVEAKDEEIMNNAFKKMSKYIKEKRLLSYAQRVC